MKGENVFAGAFVDRSVHLRRDPAWLTAAIADPATRFAPVWRKRCLAAGDPLRAVLLERHAVDRWLDPEALVFLGLYRDHAAFAVEVDPGEEAPFADHGEFHDLRYLGSMLPVDDANLVAHASALIIWHATQRFCGRCGAATRPMSGGNTRVCVADDCGRSVFPRVDPAIIVLVTDGERCLLGRQASWPAERYSTIAGFVEPGESLEDAVRREVFEETNIAVGAVRYHSSQPWPFPSSLMLGFRAQAESTEIIRHDEELEDARWFTRRDLMSGFPKLPFRLSIARRLVDDWLFERRVSVR